MCQALQGEPKLEPQAFNIQHRIFLPCKHSVNGFFSGMFSGYANDTKSDHSEGVTGSEVLPISCLRLIVAPQCLNQFGCGVRYHIENNRCSNSGCNY